MKASIASFVTLLAVLAAVSVGPALAQTVDDVNWINKCIADNKDEGQTRAVLVVNISDLLRSMTIPFNTSPVLARRCPVSPGYRGC